MNPVKLGQKVDDFTADVYTAGKFGKLKLSQYRGKWVVLFFYPKDFTFICPTEIKGFADREADFKRANAVVIGASVDSLYSHKNWFERDLPMVRFPVIADQTHKVSNLFGVLNEEGVAFRGTFIIDPQGVLRSMMVNDTSAGRSVSETLRVLQALQSGELCPVEWVPGQKTLGKA